MNNVPEKASVKIFIDLCRIRIWSMGQRRLTSHTDPSKPAVPLSSSTCRHLLQR